MNQKPDAALDGLIQKAIAGDKESLESLLCSVQDMVFSLSLRMLGTFPDAEDATQEILLKVMTHLSSFQRESSFSTWVFRIAVNHLKNYRKGMFSQHPLSFEYYSYDIEHGAARDVPSPSRELDADLLYEELKLSCTNVMLQCLDADSRCIFILGTMFHLDSALAGEILGITPEAYRQRLSRVRRKMADFLGTYCGEYGNGSCKCKNRIPYAIQSHRLNPGNIEYATAKEWEQQTLLDVKEAMEEVDGLSERFRFCKRYQSSDKIRGFLRELLQSAQLSTIQTAQKEAGK